MVVPCERELGLSVHPFKKLSGQPFGEVGIREFRQLKRRAQALPYVLFLRLEVRFQLAVFVLYAGPRYLWTLAVYSLVL